MYCQEYDYPEDDTPEEHRSLEDEDHAEYIVFDTKVHAAAVRFGIASAAEISVDNFLANGWAASAQTGLPPWDNGLDRAFEESVRLAWEQVPDDIPFEKLETMREAMVSFARDCIDDCRGRKILPHHQHEFQLPDAARLAVENVPQFAIRLARDFVLKPTLERYIKWECLYNLETRSDEPDRHPWFLSPLSYHDDHPATDWEKKAPICGICETEMRPEHYHEGIPGRRNYPRRHRVLRQRQSVAAGFML